MKFNGQSRKIIWIDDDKFILRKQRSGLMKLDWTVEAVETVDSAFEIIRSNIVARGILLDAMMDAGQSLQETDHRGGLWTGLRFVEEGINEGLFDQRNVVVLTNSGDRVLRDLIERLGVRFENKIDYMGYRGLGALIGDCFNG